MNTLNNEVFQELKAMKDVGITVSVAVLNKAKTEDLSEYDNMSVSEIADILTELY